MPPQKGLPEGVQQQPAVPEKRVDTGQPAPPDESPEQRNERMERERKMGKRNTSEQLDSARGAGEAERKIAAAPDKTSNPDEKKEDPEQDAVEQGGFAGTMNKFMKGIEKVQEAIQSVGAAALEQLAKILKMLGMEKWANAIMEYVNGADMAHLKDALDANGVKMLDPRTAEEPDAAAVKTFLADRKALFDSFGAVNKYTRKQYYTAVVKAWKDKPENVGKKEATPTELLAVARDIPKENPTPTPEPQKVEKPEDYPAFESLTSADLRAGVQKVNLDKKIVGIRILPTGTIELSPEKSAAISRKIVPETAPANAQMNITSASCESGRLSISYEQKYLKDGKSETAVDSKVLEAPNFKQLVKSLVGGTQGTIAIAGFKFES